MNALRSKLKNKRKDNPKLKVSMTKIRRFPRFIEKLKNWSRSSGMLNMRKRSLPEPRDICKLVQIKNHHSHLLDKIRIVLEEAAEMKPLRPQINSRYH